MSPTGENTSNDGIKMPTPRDVKKFYENNLRQSVMDRRTKRAAYGEVPLGDLETWKDSREGFPVSGDALAEVSRLDHFKKGAGDDKGWMFKNL